jgi:cytidylate kinase
VLGVTARTEVLMIGGRSGCGKSTVGSELHAQLSAARVPHCLIEGDNLDMAYPPPQEHRLAEQNLAAMWANYRAFGYHRMIYTNTASVLGTVITELTAAIGGDPAVTAILLRCSNTTARQRLSQREIGTALDWHVERSAVMARRLEESTPSWVHRIDTDNRAVADIAAEIIGLASWSTRLLRPTGSGS